MTKRILSLLACVSCVALLSTAAYATTYDGTTVDPDENGVYEVTGEDGDVITLNGTGGILDSITITLDGDATADVTVTATTTQPEGAPDAPVGTIYVWFDIEGDDLNSALEQAVIRFSVTKEWLNANNISSDAISLYHYVSDAWVELPTTLVSESSTAYTYTATTTSFSYFAAGASSSSTAGTGENMFIYLSGAAGLILIGIALLPKKVFAKK